VKSTIDQGLVAIPFGKNLQHVPGGARYIERSQSRYHDSIEEPRGLLVVDRVQQSG
jgi:hypothetical protein